MADGLMNPARPRPRFLAPEEAKRLVYLLVHRRTETVVVQLMAATAGAGTSTLSQDLALAAASMGLKVLLLDPAAKSAADLAAHGPFARAASPEGLTLFALDRTTLSIATPDPAAAALQVAAWQTLLPLLRQDFDLIVVDSAPLSESYDGIAFAAMVDVTVLVVEAERTPIKAVQALRDHINDAGGNIAGVLLNRRRTHLPGFVERVL